MPSAPARVKAAQIPQGLVVGKICGKLAVAALDRDNLL